VENECKGRDFLLMALQEGGMEEMQKKKRKNCWGMGRFRGKNLPTGYVGYVKSEHRPPSVSRREKQEENRKKNEEGENQEQIGPSFWSPLICGGFIWPTEELGPPSWSASQSRGISSIQAATSIS
jgi:hypothetical protein